MQAHIRISGVVMDTTAFKVSHSLRLINAIDEKSALDIDATDNNASDIDATALPAARARSEYPSGPMERYMRVRHTA